MSLLLLNFIDGIIANILQTKKQAIMLITLFNALKVL